MSCTAVGLARRLSQSWFVLPEDSASFETAVKSITAGEEGKPAEITVYGRSVSIPSATSTSARFTFDELCRSALGPADYCSIASRYSTIILDQIPILLISQKNEARRLITLIDALYETKCRLLCSAAASVDDIFFPDAVEEQAKMDELDSVTAEAASEIFMEPYRPNISAYDQTETQIDQPIVAIKQARKPAEDRHPSADVPAFRTLAIFSGEDERFAFRRAVSRMYEMNSAEYWQMAEHTPMPVEARTWEHSFALPSARARSTLGYEKDIVEDPEKMGPPLPVNAATIRVKWPEGMPEAEQTLQVNRTRGKRDPLVPTDPANRPAPPSLSSNHVWGIVDSWGKRAGRWGRGASAHEKE